MDYIVDKGKSRFEIRHPVFKPGVLFRFTTRGYRMLQSYPSHHAYIFVTNLGYKSITQLQESHDNFTMLLLSYPQGEYMVVPNTTGGLIKLSLEVLHGEKTSRVILPSLVPEPNFDILSSLMRIAQ